MNAMSTLPETSDTVTGPNRGSAPSSDERRRILRGSLAAGPVLMTVFSRSVFGQSTCGSAQTYASLHPAAGTGATSLHPDCSSDPYNTGKTASYWANHKTSWPSPYSPTTLFESPTTGLQGSTFSTHTMLDVIKGEPSGGLYEQLGKLVAAALMNAAQGLTPFLSQATVQKMWNDNLTLGYYQVSPGIQWHTSDIVTYLKNTM
jgi:hypothetical protein